MDINPYQSPSHVNDEEDVVVVEVGAPPRCCEQCGGMDFIVWKWWHPLGILWILNPGLAFNEVVLGQRVPAQLYLCRKCYQNWWSPENQYAQCPGCRRMHRVEIWTGKSAFGNWGGLVCPDCGASIACLRNLVALVILIPLAPIWWPLWRQWSDRYRVWGQRQALAGRERSYKKRPPKLGGVQAVEASA